MRCKMILAVAVVWFGGAIASAQDVATAQKKLLSQRAAIADAYRKLAETIKGLQLTSDTYVKDFVAESDNIRTELDTFIKGIKLGEPRCYDDLSCEVTAEVTVQRVIQELKSIHERHYKGKKITGHDIETIKERVEREVITAVGMGTTREDVPLDLPEGVVEQLGGPPISPQPHVPDLWRNMPPQARLMAVRAAEIDAKRQLVERIKGLRITSDTIVRDFVAESDTITTSAYSTLVGSKITGTYFHDDEPIVEVTVEVPTETVIETIKKIHTRSIQGDRVTGTDISNVTTSIKKGVFRATGRGVPPQRLLKQYNAKVAPEARLPDWAMEPIVMQGNGVAPDDKAGTAQGKLLAARAAELDAKRKLAEYVDGLEIESTTTVKDFVTQNDDIKTRMQAVLVGAEVQKTEFDGDIAIVTVALPGVAVWDVIHDQRRINSR